MKDKVQDVEGNVPSPSRCAAMSPPTSVSKWDSAGRRQTGSAEPLRSQGAREAKASFSCPCPAPVSPSLISLVNLQVKLGCLCKNTLALSEPAESENGGAGEARSEGHDGGSLGRWGGGRSRKTGAEQWCKGPVSHPCRWVPQSPELWNRTLGHPRSSPEASSSL